MKHEHVHIAESFFFFLWKLGWLLWEDSIKSDCYKENCSIKYEWKICKTSHKTLEGFCI